MTKDKDIAKIIEDFKREMRAELRSVKDSVKFCSDTCDETKAIGSDVKALRKEISDLIKLNESLRNENKRLGQRIEELELYSRLNNLEIKGVRSDDAPANVVKKIGEAIDEPISDSDIDTCHRMPTRKPDEKNIIVRFVRRDKRHAFLAKARKQRVSNESLGYTDQGLVYVNEHLTPATKQLLGAAIARKKRVAWKFVWTSGGRIFARKEENSDAIKILDHADLNKMT